MPASTYRGDFKHVPVASASTALTGGTLAYQEGWLGVVITGCASGKSTQLDCEGVHLIPVPASTVKGDFLYATPAITPGSDVYPVTLTRTAAAGLTIIGKALGDRDTAGKALVMLAPNTVGTYGVA